MFRSALAAAVFLLAAIDGQAQEVNPTNMFVVPIRYAGVNVRIGTPIRITDSIGFTRSQPSFTPDGRGVVMSARRRVDSDVSDVYLIDIATRRGRWLTDTPENENSPTISANGEIRAIRWNPPTLFREFGPWIYSPDGTPSRAILPQPDTVGYYAHIDDATYVLMRPAKRFSVALFDAKTGKTTDLDWPVATLSPQRLPGRRAVSFTRTDSTGKHVIRMLDLNTRQVTTIAPALVGRTVHTWGRDGILFMARTNRLYARDTRRAGDWRVVATFDSPELQNISSAAVSPKGDHLVLFSTSRPRLSLMLSDLLYAGQGVDDMAAFVNALRQTKAIEKYEVSDAQIGGVANDRLNAGLVEHAMGLRHVQLALFPQSGSPLAGLGDVHAKMGESQTAITYYRRALALTPRITEADKSGAESLEKKIRDLESSTSVRKGTPR